MTTEIDLLEEILREVKKEESKSLIVLNDNYNTFQHVIDCFIKYCDHNPMQAEQCALIVHHNGKCDVKHGSFDKLKPVCEALLEQGLTAKIEE